MAPRALQVSNLPLTQQGDCPADPKATGLSEAVLKFFVIGMTGADPVCTSSIINDHRLLTAAHCVHPSQLRPIDYSGPQGTELTCLLPAAYPVSTQCSSSDAGCDQDVAVCTRTDGSPFPGTARLAVINNGLSQGDPVRFAGFGRQAGQQTASICPRHTTVAKPGNWGANTLPIQHYANLAHQVGALVANHDSGGPVLVGNDPLGTIAAVVVRDSNSPQIGGRSLEPKAGNPIQTFLDCALKLPAPPQLPTLPQTCP